MFSLADQYDVRVDFDVETCGTRQTEQLESIAATPMTTRESFALLLFQRVRTAASAATKVAFSLPGDQKLAHEFARE